MKLFENIFMKRQARRLLKKKEKKSKKKQSSESAEFSTTDETDQPQNDEEQNDQPNREINAHLGAIPKQKASNEGEKSARHMTSGGIEVRGFSYISEFHENDKQKLLQSATNNLKKLPKPDNNEASQSTKMSMTDIEPSTSSESLDFQSLRKKIEKKLQNAKILPDDETKVVDIDALTDSEYQHLKPIIHAELQKIFEKYHIMVIKRKYFPTKERGMVFNTSLQSLLMRDMLPSNSMIPQIFQMIIRRLSILIEEKNLVNSIEQKYKVEGAVSEIEQKFYTNRFYCERIILELNILELMTLLRKLIKELQEPIFTMELYDWFYKTTMIPVKKDRIRALNFLVLLLPLENRNTLREVILLYTKVINNVNFNYMTLTNVAGVITQDFFDPDFLNQSAKKQKSCKNSIDLLTSTYSCCNVIETFLKFSDRLWLVPKDMAIKARESYKAMLERKEQVEKKRPPLPLEPPSLARRRRLRKSNCKQGSVPLPDIEEDMVLQLENAVNK